MKIYRKILLIITCTCMLLINLSGCGKINEEANKVYDNNDKIVSDEDTYYMSNSIKKSRNNNYSFKASNFSGSNTIARITFSSPREYVINYSVKIQEGKLKLIVIDKDKNIIFTSENPSGNVSCKIDGVNGPYRVKLVGENAKFQITSSLKDIENVKLDIIE
ncbi:hypothetical protein [Clostridium sp. 'White wine YQ']|uniref:hypothetical protein n=1 Tax=Clostridium sp. 'White wine YQ' TaxID=3027474 RepID=UPI0023665928|nr:hypothetical protein [Clostridium sp. 'White wine YQ']MDD7795428.1 hypothetical protein [Clostridium sp. 'White wine YQ']